jgi:hypothetical protein
MKPQRTESSRICFIAVGSAGLNQVRKLIRKWQQGPWRDRLQVSLHYVGDDYLDPRDWSAALDAIEGNDMVFLDTMGAPKDFSVPCTTGWSASPAMSWCSIPTA